MAAVLEVTLSYYGRAADRNEIDLYDVAQALTGFQRSLALTTHLVLNNEIITQATSLKGARILSRPPEEGSWKATVMIILGGLWASGTVSKDTPIGNLLSSAYDYVIHETLGFHVDYTKSLGAQYDDYVKSHSDIKKLEEHRLTSVGEKCTSAIRDMHRPIAFSETAKSAIISVTRNFQQIGIGPRLDQATFDYINYNIQSETPIVFCGFISGYNLNTYSGRIYIPDARRLISFYISESGRSNEEISMITKSLSDNAQVRNTQLPGSEVCFHAYTITSKTGRLKKLIVTGVITD